MARAHLKDVVQEASTGAAIASPTIQVEETSGALLAATLYSGATGGGTLANPFTGASNGTFEFYLTNPQRVQIRVTVSGRDPVTSIYDVTVPDPVTQDATRAGATTQAQDFGATYGILTDLLSESTSGAGVNLRDPLKTLTLPWVDPTNSYYGADRTGVTDSRTAFLNAWNDAKALTPYGGVVMPPPGKYLLGTGAVTLNLAQTAGNYGTFAGLIGQGPGVVFVPHADMANQATPLVTFNVGWGLNTLKNVYFQLIADPGGATTDATALLITACNYARFENLFFYGRPSTYPLVKFGTSVSDTSWENCVFRSYYSYTYSLDPSGTLVQFGTANIPTNTWFRTCQWIGADKGLAQAAGATNCNVLAFDECEFAHNHWGVYLDQTIETVAFRSCRSEYTEVEPGREASPPSEMAHFYLKGSRSVVVDNCWLTGMDYWGQYGIIADSVLGLTVRDCTAKARGTTSPGSIAKFIKFASTSSTPTRVYLLNNRTTTENPIRVAMEGASGIMPVPDNFQIEQRSMEAGGLISYTMSGWVKFGTQNPALGTLPAYTYVESVAIHVTEAFNSSGTDLLSVGYDADVDAFATDTDVSTTGVKTTTLGVLAGYNSTTRAVEAYYVNGGTEPTTGAALVTLTYRYAPYQTAAGPYLFRCLKTLDITGPNPNGTTFTDYSIAARDSGGDAAILSSLDTLANGDAVFVASDLPVVSMTVTLGTSNSNASVLAVHYWNGAWTAVGSLSDGTISPAGTTLGQNGAITWAAPGDEATTYVNYIKGYWYRLTVSAALDSTTTIQQIVLA